VQWIQGEARPLPIAPVLAEVRVEPATPPFTP
jgi:hypothetical protein